MAIVPVGELEQLVFSGGGARALVHIGAIRSIERALGTSSIAEARFQGKSTLRGFAGASAGGLISLALATGYSSKDLQRFLRYQTTPPPEPQKGGIPFPPPLATLDAMKEKGRPPVGIPVMAGPKSTLAGPNKRIYGAFLHDLGIKQALRYYDKNGLLLIQEVASKSGELIAKIPNPYAQALGQGGKSLGALFDTHTWAEAVRQRAGRVARTAAKQRKKKSDSILRRAHRLRRGQTEAAPPDLRWVTTRDRFPSFMYNLAADGGMLVGLDLYRLITSTMIGSPLGKWAGWSVSQAQQVTFAGLRELTQKWIKVKAATKPRSDGGGFDLVVTGVNLASRQVGYFSAEHTPDFPVFEAVAISMRFPLLYKPLRISPGAPVPESYYGQWVDGGLLNNFPLHAFSSSDYEALGHRVLGFYLKEDRNFKSAVTVDQMLVRQAREILGTLTSRSTTDSMRGLLEELQSVELNADGMSTLDMIPDRRLVEKCAKKAEEQTDWRLRNRRCDPRIKKHKQIPWRSFEEIARSQLRGVYHSVSRGSLRVYIGTPKNHDVDAWASFDIVAATLTGHLVVYDAKSSATAPLTDRQRRIVQRLKTERGFLWPSSPHGYFTKGAVIREQWVRIVRPASICEECDRVLTVSTLGGTPLGLGPQPEDERGDNYP
ncbi:MAG: patatin-like phospholipase family protein [Myxococcota bacterium]|nr:patatin-like phospholipase family protein [Myxococcota bacterium]